MPKKSKTILDYLHFATHAPNLEELWADHTRTPAAKIRWQTNP